MLSEGKRKRLARQGMLHQELLERLRDARWADHLVLDGVLEPGAVVGHRQPPQDVVGPGFGQHVRDAVAHAEVGAHGAVEHAAEDAEYVCGGAADVHADEVDPFSLRYAFHDAADSRRGGHDGGAGPLHEFFVAGGVGHDVLEEELLDVLAGRAEIFLLEAGPDVLDDAQGGHVAEHGADVVPCVAVAGVDDGQAEGAAEPGPGPGGADELCQLHHVRDRAAIRAAAQQDHVGAQGADAGYLLVRQAAVVGGDHVHHDGAGPEGGLLCALSGHCLDGACHQHLKPAAGAAGGDIDVHTALAVGGPHNVIPVQDSAPAQFLKFLYGIEHATGDVLERRLDGRGRLPTTRQAVALGPSLNEDGLGGRAPAVRGEDHVVLLTVRRSRHFLSPGQPFAAFASAS